ncbi:MAG TPA: aminotransferase class V-fold PLP-dependent enzyme [Rhodothermia bacterium]
MSAQAFRDAGHQLVDVLADFLARIHELPVTPDKDPSEIRALLGPDKLPDHPVDPAQLLRATAEKLIANSLHNGHPRFWAYITSSADPVGILGDLIASSINPNVALWHLSPLATEIELQAIRWIADLIGYPRNCGGILVSGGNMANLVCFMAARRAMAGWPIDADGLQAGPKLVMYVSSEAHTWVDKAADLFGLGAKQVRWIDVDGELRMNVELLEQAIHRDRLDGVQPFMVVGTAGSVSTGTVDPLGALSDLCRKEHLWFHVDGAYGAFAAALPGAPRDLASMRFADSIALDPHKWLHAPLEAGCALVRNLEDLERTFSHKPFYLMTDPDEPEQPAMFVERGPQNSRGFRALKVWLGMQAAGRSGIVKSIAEDVALSRHMASCLRAHPEIQLTSQSLSIATFRYVPDNVDPISESTYLNELNKRVLQRLQSGGQVFLSQANVRGAYTLRACIVNFRTTAADVEALPDLVAGIGRALHESRHEWMSA